MRIPEILGTAAGGLLGLLLALPAAAQELRPLPPEAHDQWQAIGRVNTRGYNRRGMCSGTLVAPDLVLTAAHCVTGPQGDPVRAERLHFVAGWLGGDYADHAAVTAYQTHPGAYDRGRLDIEHDLALLTLARPLDVLPLTPGRTAGRAPKPPFAVIGYHDRQPNRLSARFDCAGGQDRALLRLTCPVRRGNSGGPVLAREDGGTWAIVGVVSATSAESSLAVPLDGWIRARLPHGAPYTP